MPRGPQPAELRFRVVWLRAQGGAACAAGDAIEEDPRHPRLLASCGTPPITMDVPCTAQRRRTRGATRTADSSVNPRSRPIAWSMVSVHRDRNRRDHGHDPAGFDAVQAGAIGDLFKLHGLPSLEARDGGRLLGRAPAPERTLCTAGAYLAWVRPTRPLKTAEEWDEGVYPRALMRLARFSPRNQCRAAIHEQVAEMAVEFFAEALKQ